ncbi:hypothetical protein KP509_39G018100 [Ceratopteris richardii]|uniref:Uncharacterized protein n=1 Tax=Ceratopteris richardii TaxID=49495 RepID=A0A8T2PZ59_CERRI|nr:hypothetical protein KP509_39G018100 [Ceratopteris richardii]KAH7276698.1 hypothetical protein KP509_39G018100 [Ceratopteris richardii]KAH7276699.1 hypothetical protein KP509_39G018100 [Ceratopteris richardii]
MSYGTPGGEKDENFPDNNSEVPALLLQAKVHANTNNNKSQWKPKRKSAIKQKLDGEDSSNLFHGSNPLTLELSRLENEVRDKDRELQKSQAEIKAPRLTDCAREKSLEELNNELKKMEAKLKQTELILENKKLEVKMINGEKKAAVAAQAVAEATLRRVQSAAQKDVHTHPIEIILEAELKMAQQEVSKLQESNSSLDRLTKSKEAALLEAEKTIQIAETKASIVDDLQNRNQEMRKQLNIYQEESKILGKIYRQKVAEVGKLSTTIKHLEEIILAGGATANADRESKKHVNVLMEEKKTLEHELAHVKVTANRGAVVVANEWKDANDKVIPAKQWLEERRFLQGELQELRNKLSIAEHKAKAEAQLKEKFQHRLRVLEDCFKSSNTSSSYLPPREGAKILMNESATRSSFGGQGNGLNGSEHKQTSSSQFRFFLNSPLRNIKLNRSFDGGNARDKSGSKGKFLAIFGGHKGFPIFTDSAVGMKEKLPSDNEAAQKKEDAVSGVLYDLLQKEVISLRKAIYEKDQSLKDKDNAIEMLSKKVDTLSKAMDFEAKKMRREVANMEKEVAAMRMGMNNVTRLRQQGAGKLASK